MVNQLKLNSKSGSRGFKKQTGSAGSSKLNITEKIDMTEVDSELQTEDPEEDVSEESIDMDDSEDDSEGDEDSEEEEEESLEDEEEGAEQESDDEEDAEEEEEDDDEENELDLNELANLNFEEFADSVESNKIVRKSIEKNTETVEKEESAPVEVQESSSPGTSNGVSKKKMSNKKKGENPKVLVERAHPDPKNYDEYVDDSSDEEDIRNTIGNVPLNWYDEYPHIGYDLDGKKLVKPKMGDKLDEFLRRMEDPNFWRTVKDPQTNQSVVLSDQDLNLITRIQSGKLPDANFDDYAPWIEWFSNEVMETPLRAIPDSKASFLPSKIDKMKISRMVHAIKMGWMKPKPKASTEKQFYMLWNTDDQAEDMRRIHDHVPAPKIRLPGNAESYNPPAEYLFDEKEMENWKYRADEPWKRKYNFIPQKYSSLRKVPAYDRYIKERFERCLDLYLCPRTKKMRLTIRAEDLVPQLPNPKDLQPFPTVLSMTYKGHAGMVRSISLEPHGQFFASGSDDGTVKVWEVATGRCMKTFTFEGTVRSVEWCPNKFLCLIAIAVENNVVIINPRVGDKLMVEKTDALLQDSPDMGDYAPSDRLASAIQWEPIDEEKRSKDIRIVIKHFKQVHQVTWHAKGDYFATVMPDGQNRSVVIHQLSSRKSQLPLSKSKGLVQRVIFHPVRPLFFVATQRHVRIYDLVKQEIVKKLVSGSKWISSIAIHPGGDNIIVGTYDKKVSWFDLDLSTKPYQTLRHHGNAVRTVAFHKRYPLFASGSDDCSVIVCHGMVYNDLLQNPLIVPVKKLKGHSRGNDFGILQVTFHNLQPWVFSAGADQTIKLFT